MPMSASSSAARPAAKLAAKSDRQFDVVLFGATGFVGRQTAAYFAGHADVKSSGLRWALAGRNQAKLEEVRKNTVGAKDAGVVVAAADDIAALNALAKNARVVLSTAGPFALYGEQLVAACVRHGTHYVDITGETPWVSGLIAQHHATAARQGTRIIPFCGFDSVPSDLGAFMLVQAMQANYGTPCVDVKAAFSLKGGVNGGTLASLFNLMGSAQAAAMRNVFLLNPPGTQPAHIAAHADPVLPAHDRQFNAWLGPFFMSVVNTRVVRRSAALLGNSVGYGEGNGADFHYQEYLRVGRGLTAAAAASTLSGSMAISQLAMKLPAMRKLVAAVAPKAGYGPSVASMDGGSFRCELVATNAAGNEMRGLIADQGDPGNRATTKMVCEAALCLALEFDSLPGGSTAGGVLTPATALGNTLVQRLRRAGMQLSVNESSKPHQ